MFLPIFAALSKHKVRYLVIGGVAVNLHGYSRTTGDLDILLDLEAVNIQRFLKAVDDLGLKPSAPIELNKLVDPVKRKRWIREKNLKAVSFYDPKEPLLSLDVLIDFKIDFGRAYRQRDPQAVGKGTIPLISLKNLIQLKKISDRQRDLTDIRALQLIQKINHEKTGQKSNNR